MECSSLCLAVKVLLSLFVCHCHCMSAHFIWIRRVKKGSVLPKRSKSRRRIALCFYLCVFCACLKGLLLSRSSHVYLSPPQRNNTSGRNTHADIRDCWLVTVIPSSHFWCKWGEIKGYHLSAHVLRTSSFPALCTTSICKEGFLSIRLHEYRHFPLVKPWNETWFVLYSAFWNYNMSIFF